MFVSQIPGADTNENSAISYLHERRLALLYFGLLFLGLATGLFILLAPEPIRKFSNVRDYIADMEEVTSKSLVEGRFNHILLMFLRVKSEEARSPLAGYGSIAFPSKVMFYLHDLISEIILAMDVDDLPLPTSTEPYGTMFNHSPHIIHRTDGYATTDKIIEMMTGGGAIHMHLYRSVVDELKTHSRQIYFIDYEALNFSRPIFRLLCATMYLISVTLLIVPTLVTSYLIILSL